MRIVFMGTPEYSVATLRALLTAGHEIAAVYAQPDKPVGRKRVLTPPPTKAYALERGIPVCQPATLRTPEAAQQLKESAPDLIVVVAYGKLLPPEILAIPPYGCINAHASLLPKYRGASPIQWSIVCGETETGVTLQQMDAGMDTGAILDAVRVPIEPEETAGRLFARLSPISADLTVRVVEQIASGTATPTPQPEEGVSYAPILNKEMALLDFTQPAAALHNAVRGFHPWPCAYFFLDGRRFKVHECRVGGRVCAPPGTVVAADSRLIIACGDGNSLELLTLQPEGGRPMPAEALLRGHGIAAGARVTGE